MWLFFRLVLTIALGIFMMAICITPEFSSLFKLSSSGIIITIGYVFGYYRGKFVARREVSELMGGRK